MAPDVPANVAANGNNRVRAEALASRGYVIYLHVGPYRSETKPDLAAARARFTSWVDGHGLGPLERIEHFRIGPVEEPDSTKWESELAHLIV